MRQSRRGSNGHGLRIALLALAVAIGFLGVWLWEQHDRRTGVADDSAYRFTVNFNGQWYRLRDRLETYLIIGLDKDSDRLEHIDPQARLNNLQSDFLLLVIADRAAQTLKGLHINRDTMAEITRIGREGERLSSVTEQLALAHTYGSGGKDSCVNTVHAISDFLYGVPIDHFFSLTMDAVPALTDLVDGVPVYVEDDFSKTAPALKQGETVLLRGDLALTFVRSRMSVADGSNLNRMARQRVYLDSLHERLKEKLGAEGNAFALRLAKGLAPYTVSDLLTEELASRAERMGDYRFEGVEDIKGSAVMGVKYIEFYPDTEALQEQLVRLMFEKVPDAA